MLKMSIIFVNTPSSMLFMMYQHKSCKNKPLSYTTTPQTAHKQYFWLYKKCKNSDFGVVLCYQEEDVPRNKCLLLLRILPLVSKHNIDYWNLLSHKPRAFKTGFFAKNPYLKRPKIDFLIFGHEDLSRYPRYYGCLYIPISYLAALNMTPKC